MTRDETLSELRAQYVANMETFADGDMTPNQWTEELERIADQACHEASRLKLKGLDRSDFIRAICAPVPISAEPQT
jgi:hypothetical protein